MMNDSFQRATFWAAALSYVKITGSILIAFLLFFILDAPSLADIVASYFGFSIRIGTFLLPIWARDLAIGGIVWMAGFLTYMKMLEKTGSYRFSREARLRPILIQGDGFYAIHHKTPQGGVTAYTFRLGVEHLAPGISEVEVFVDRINDVPVLNSLLLQKSNSQLTFGTGDVELFNLACAWVARELSAVELETAEESSFDRFYDLLKIGMQLETEASYGKDKPRFSDLTDVRLDLRIESANSPTVRCAVLIKVKPNASIQFNDISSSV